MTIRLKTITVTDFRSIRGTVIVELDSPVVLIHGQNGSGKTSLLTAIELGLTGKVNSLARIDTSHIAHLVHKAATEARVVLTVSRNGRDETSEVVVRDGKILGSGLLTDDECVFYVERCYLAQSTLGRLLEIYQNKDAAATDSPLTVFVKELLGLDQLEDLIEGLHAAGDVRRLRNGSPLYWAARERLPELEREQFKHSKSVEGVNSEIEEAKQALQKGLADLGLPSSVDLESAKAPPLFSAGGEDEKLRSVARFRRDIAAALDQWNSLQSNASRVEREGAEASLRAASATAEHWRAGYLHQFEKLFADLSAYFSNLPTVTSTRPRHAVSVAEGVVAEELKRCSAILDTDSINASTLASSNINIAAHEARIASLDHQVAEHSAQAGSLARALSALLPHVHSDNCPVCSRDFGEISNISLSAHLTQSIGSLTQSASRLEALTRERAEAVISLAQATRARTDLASRVLPDATKNELKTRAARMSEFSETLKSLSDAAVTGEEALRIEAEASARLNEIQARDVKLASLRTSADQFAQQLGVSPIEQGESLSSALQRFVEHVEALERDLVAKETARQALRTAYRGLLELLERRGTAKGLLNRTKSEADTLARAKAISDDRIENARELARRAREERTHVVRRVFNESLNALWSDLFVRLAPDEPFVPAFALPQSPTGAVEAVLETHYRSGGRGGNPQAMLSAGNLNTAALTLFLALHLSARPQLPLLVIDDPVQSMDEVHIAQFAALLRTISKQHRRQVLIAVHDKPLFDYLSLELSPAFQSDRLVTVDIARQTDSQTAVNYEPISWLPDRAIAA